MMLFPNSFTILAYVREERGLFLFEHRRNIDIRIGQKTPGLIARIDLEEVKVRSIAKSHAGADGKETGDLMVHVGVDWPMGKDDVGSFSRKKAGHRLNVRLGHFCGAVDLAEEKRLGPDNFAGRFAFGRTNPCGFIERFVPNPAFATG